MKCPQCGEKILENIMETEEEILPYKEQGKLFPIQITVIELRIYKCNCGTIIKIPEYRHYNLGE